ncbi:WxcM-like domain-containing protein [Nibribacter ruber]|uniref:WxcM-like domain-containing protein n=1 Tax=Nibribacter ruber TaxID=2698458 RepID=A0A6P1P1I6_9BACT|nr:FdtA/QdtA family cupin domain-containing protein [Nibribacter ruber]QHL87302.1 WxcM-like domain-containing protein [Nibribacter ruber]
MKYPAPHLLSFQQINDVEGILISTQNAEGLPFTAKRAFWVMHTTPDSERGGHAHHTTQELMAVLKGAVRIETETAQGKDSFLLDSPTVGLYIPPYCWIKVFPTPDAILCCLASTVYEEADYMREYAEFQKIIQAHSNA